MRRVRDFVPWPGDPGGVRQGGGAADTGVVSAATTTPPVVVWAPGRGAKSADAGHPPGVSEPVRHPPPSEVLAADRPGCSGSGLVEVVGDPGLLGDRVAGRGPGAAVCLPGLRRGRVEPVAGPGRGVAVGARPRLALRQSAPGE